jgi:hypothetical protein
MASEYYVLILQVLTKNVKCDRVVKIIKTRSLPPPVKKEESVD